MILPEHGGESVFQQDYLRGMQYNVYAKALFAPFGNQNHTLHTCGNSLLVGTEHVPCYRGGGRKMNVLVKV